MSEVLACYLRRPSARMQRSRRFRGVAASVAWIVGAMVTTSALVAFQPAGPAISEGLSRPNQSATPTDSSKRSHPTGFFEGWFVSRNTGWMVIHQGSQAILSRTDDGGVHWQPQLPLEYPKLFQRNMSFADANTGFVVTGVYAQDKVDWKLLATVDGGSHWIARSLPAEGPVGGLDFVSARVGWVLESTPSGMSTVSATRDGGSSWTSCQNLGFKTNAVPFDRTDHLEGIRFADAAHGWVAGWKTSGPNAGQALYYYTSDGCLTWQPMLLPRAQRSGSESSVWFVDPPQFERGHQTGIVLTRHGQRGFELDYVSNFVGSSAWLRTGSQPSFDLRFAEPRQPLMSPSVEANAFGVQRVDNDFAVAEAPAQGGGVVLLITANGGSSWSKVPLSLGKAVGSLQPRVVDTYCRDTQCNYVDPQAEGCSATATTVYTILPNWPYSYNDELRYDPTHCLANWGRTANAIPNPPGCGSGCPSGVDFDSTDAGLYTQQNPLSINNTWSDLYWPPPNHWTLMLSGGSSYDRVCRPQPSSICTYWG